jgi:hypothetical protein
LEKNSFTKRCSRITKVTATIPPFKKPPNILRSNSRQHKRWLIVNKERTHMYWQKKAAQKTKQNKRYSKKSDIVSKVKHRFSRVSDPCFKSLTKGKRSVRKPFGAGARFGSSSKRPSLAIGRGKDLTGVQGYLRTTEGQTSLTIWLTRTTSNNKSSKGYRNSQRDIFSRKRNQNKSFGSKVNKTKGYRKNQSDNFSKLPVRRNKFTRKQQKNLGKILVPYFGKQIV